MQLVNELITFVESAPRQGIPRFIGKVILVAV